MEMEKNTIKDAAAAAAAAAALGKKSTTQIICKDHVDPPSSYYNSPWPQFCTSYDEIGVNICSRKHVFQT
jgi:hypothetical protein